MLGWDPDGVAVFSEEMRRFARLSCFENLMRNFSDGSEAVVVFAESRRDSELHSRMS